MFLCARKKKWNCPWNCAANVIDEKVVTENQSNIGSDDYELIVALL